jgi:hypothetical protein
MAFRFESLGQEIHVWHILNKGPYDYDGPNKAFFSALYGGGQVELAEGAATHVANSPNDRYEGNSWVVFEYRGKQWRMDLDEYDSWDEGDEPTEPYEVVAKPVNEVQYVRA